MEVQVLRVMVSEGSDTALVFGEPLNDPTVVVVAGLDRRQAEALAAFATQADGMVVVDIPEGAVLAVLELP